LITRQREKQGEGDETGEKEKVVDDAVMVLNGEGGGGERKCVRERETERERKSEGKRGSKDEREKVSE
jgi:hypothetical protein